MAENLLPFVSEICIMSGSCFLRQLGLLVLVCTTSCMCIQSVHMFSLQNAGRAKTRPARPLATAMQPWRVELSVAHPGREIVSYPGCVSLLPHGLEMRLEGNSSVLSANLKQALTENICWHVKIWRARTTVGSAMRCLYSSVYM